MPPPNAMWDAARSRDRAFDGLFWFAVRTTGIFCRPSCPARRPRRENVRFYPSAGDALRDGFRPCRRCRPLEPPGGAPSWLRPLLADLDSDARRRWRDRDLRARGLDPARVRRWFKRNHHMTFHAYQRARRVGSALRHLSDGGSVTETAFEHGWESLSAFQEAVRGLTGLAPHQARASRVVELTRIETPLGPMLAGADDEALRLLEFTDRRMLETQLRRLQRRLGCALVPGDGAILADTAAQLGEYFDGQRREFTIPVAPAGTEFQQDVWRELRAIPYGRTRSYGEQAAAMGRPEAVRAVARANGDNPVAVIVPCHRVIGADGSLTGYGGGLWRKQWLLELESRHAGLDVTPLGGDA